MAATFPNDKEIVNFIVLNATRKYLKHVILRHNHHGRYYTIKYSFIHQLFYGPLLRPGLFFSFVVIFTQTVGLLGRVISTSQGRYLHTGQHKHPCLEWDSNPRYQRSSKRRLHALHRAATVIGCNKIYQLKFLTERFLLSVMMNRV
jgi:hypothetical protein